MPAATVTAFLLVLMMFAQLYAPQVSTAASASQTGQAPWWNDAYQFRQSLTVVDGGSTPLANQTVLVHLIFPVNDVEDPFSGVRLVNSSSVEIPSAIIGPQYSGIFLRSSYLLFLVNLEAGSNATYYVYYGGVLQSTPSYRSTGPATSLASTLVTAAAVPLSVDSTQLRLTFGTIDSETMASKVSYAGQSSRLEYGPTGFSRSPFSDDSGLTMAGDLNPQTAVAYDVLQAGQVELTRVLVLTPRAAITIDAVSNGASTVAGNVSLTSVVGLGGLSTLRNSHSVYSSGSALLYTSNPDAYFGVQQFPSPSSFDLGTESGVTAEASSGAFSGVDAYDLASAAGFTWDLGDINPSEATWVSSAWGVASAAQQIQASLPKGPLGVFMGKEEVLPVSAPTARSLWSASLTLTNVPISPSGLVIPLGAGGGRLVPGASTVSGTYAYSVPPSPQLNSNVWTDSTTSTGNGTVFASSSYYAFDLGQNVERLSGTVPNVNSSVTASLISAPGLAFSGTNAMLEVKYKASHSATAGSLSGQAFFVSADLDPTLTGNFSQSLVLPVSGSSTTVPTSGCALTGPTAAPLEMVTPSGLLIGDGTWRTLSLALPSSLPAGGFNVMLRLCLSTSPGFSGELDLEVASVGVVLSGQAPAVLQTDFSSSPPELTIGYLPQALSVASVGTVANLTISEVIMMNASIGWRDGSTFSGAITAPSPLTLNDTSLTGYASVGPPSLDGISVGSAVSSYAEAGTIDGVDGVASPGSGAAMLSASGLTNVSSGSLFIVDLRAQTVNVEILDQNGAGVTGVRIVPIENGRSLPVSATTNATGIAPVQLVPWNFQFNATYQGVGIGSVEIQAGAPPSVSLTANLYKLTLVVKDSRGGVLPDAQLTLSIGNYTFTGTTSADGSYSFEGIAGSLYDVTVSVGGNSYPVGQITATANNVVISVTTSYLSPSEELLVVGLVALVPVIVVAGYFAARRLRGSK